jgi:Fic family protein
MTPLETPQRIEPARLEETTAAIADVIADLSAASARLGVGLHPRTAGSLADLVRVMNTYYSNLIEGHNTRPRDIVSALEGHLDDDERRRNLQLEAAAHVRVQRQIDAMAAEGRLPEPASGAFITWLHHAFYADAPPDMLRMGGQDGALMMQPGVWRNDKRFDVAVGRHIPPSSDRVDDFMHYFEARFDFSQLKMAGRMMAMASAHHRFNYIHPFPDGNGRVSRLMSHAMAQLAGIGAHGLWSISRGLARGLQRPGEYKSMMDRADTERQGDLDGRGNLSLRALNEFVLWFLEICLDQVTFMESLFEIDRLGPRLNDYVDRVAGLKPEARHLLQEALTRGQFERGEIARITGLPDRTARRVLADTIAAGLLNSDTPKGAVSLRFPPAGLDVLFPRLFPET